MKKILFVLFSGLFLIFTLFSCNPAPETFDQGMLKFNEKSYEEAITLFKLSPKSAEPWYDSSVVMINKSIDSIYTSNNLAKITKICKLYELDSLLKPMLTSKAVIFWNKNLEKDPMLAFNMFDSLRFILKGLPGIDTIMRKNEDAFFKGIWKCSKGSLKGKEIYFQRDNETNLILAKSNKSGGGWDLGKTIYKDIFYMGNNILDHRVRVFHTDYWGYTSESFTKNKGKMSIFSSDSLLVDYEGAASGSRKHIFVKQKKNLVQ